MGISQKISVPLALTPAPSPLAERVLSLMRAAVQRIFRVSQPVERGLSVEERLMIGPKKTLMIVNCHGRRFLVASAADMIAPLIEVHPASEDRACAGGKESGL